MKKIKIIVITIVLLQLIFKLIIDYNKNGFFVDEMYSYGLMNYKQAYLFDEETFINNWHDKEYYDDYITIKKGDFFKFAQIYSNQVEDYHPPLYYLLLRLFSFFCVGTFSKWTGLILNLVIFIICDVLVYKIGKNIFKTKWITLLLVFIYGFSLFSAENTLFIRMYQLLEMDLLLLVNWGISNYKKEKLNFKDYRNFVFIIMLGSLTQYYFLIFLVPFLIIYLVKFVKEVRYKELMFFILSFLTSQLLVFALYPNYFAQITRGTERNENTILTGFDIKNILEREIQYSKILDYNMFFCSLKYILIGVLILLLIITIGAIIKNKTEVKFNFRSELVVIIIPVLFYCLYITTSQYIALRYISPIFVFLLLILLWVVASELKILTKGGKYYILCMIIFSIICTIPFPLKKIEYQYYANKDNYKIIEKYKTLPSIFFYDKAGVLENNFMVYYDYIRRFDKCYIMEKKFYTIKQLEKALEQVDVSNGIIIITDSKSIETIASRIVEKVDCFTDYTDILDLTDNYDNAVYPSFYLIE